MGALSTAAGQYGDLTGQGISAMGIGNDMAMGAYDKMTQAGMIDKADRQGQLDADKAQWEGEDQRNWDLLNSYDLIIGGNQWDTPGTSSGRAEWQTNGRYVVRGYGEWMEGDGEYL